MVDVVAVSAATAFVAWKLHPALLLAPTTTGLYMQSTISSPFVFYIQSEISVVPQQEDVRLFYGPAGVDRFGAALTTLAVLLVLGAGVRRATTAHRLGGRNVDGFPGARMWSRARGTAARPLDIVFAFRPVSAPLLAVLLGVGAIAVRMAWSDLCFPHRDGLIPQRPVRGRRAAAVAIHRGGAVFGGGILICLLLRPERTSHGAMGGFATPLRRLHARVSGR